MGADRLSEVCTKPASSKAINQNIREGYQSRRQAKLKQE
jgi:hypothetical protein